MLKFTCENCQYSRSVQDKLSGKRVQCPKCKSPGVIPVHINAEGDSCGIIEAELIEPVVVHSREPQVRCPYCAELILAVAIKCKSCGEVLRQIQYAKESAVTRMLIASILGASAGGVISLIGFAIVASGFMMDTTVGEVHNIGLQQKQMLTTLTGIAVSVVGIGIISVGLILFLKSV